MSKHGQPMSQTLAQMHLNELKMNDPKLNKIFDKLKKGNTVKIKHSSTLERGKDFIEYIVKSKNVVNKGRVEKITLASKDNPTAVKKFLYKRDGKVTFAVGDMAASIDDIKEKYSIINHEIIEDIEVEELDEMKSKSYALAIKGKVVAKGSKADMMKLKKQKGGELYLSPGTKIGDMVEEVELNEAKSSSGYELYHNSFANAMSHAYTMAKKIHRVDIDRNEIDDKVATGPKKPSVGKTNKYRLKGKGGVMQIQVYNSGEKIKPYELNMYKESVELGEQMKPEDSLKNWKHKDAKGYAEKLIKEYGQPDEVTETMLKWNTLGSFGEGERETFVLDESIPHSFPKPHRDYVYTTMNIKVPSDMLDTLGYVTGSIIYDGLKEEVTARCGSLYANAATLGFVRDMVEGKVTTEKEGAKKEYADRITKDPLPKTYDNRMNEDVSNMCTHSHHQSYQEIIAKIMTNRGIYR